MRLLATILAASLLVGCAAPQPVPEEIKRVALEPLVCEGADQCRTWWQRAQVWIARNSAWKIQTATDSIIETYNGRDGSLDRAYQVIKEPLVGGKERILIRSGCRNSFGCNSNELEMAAQFKMYVRFGG